MSDPVEGVLEYPIRQFRPYPTYKDSAVGWLGKVPAHWDIDRFKTTVTSCQNGLWGDEPDGLNDVICVRVADFDRVRHKVNLIEPTLRSVDKLVLPTRSLKKGDLLLEKSGGGEKQPVGAVVLYDHPESAICSNFVAKLEVAQGFDARYLAYLHSAAYSARLNTRSIKQNTGIQNLDSDSYLNEKASLPPLSEQHSIAAFLNRETAKIDALVAKKERLIELLKEKRTALITKAVTKGLDPDATMKESGVEWLGSIPAHWGVSRLRLLLRSIEQGWSPSAEDREAGEDEWGVIKLSAIHRGCFNDHEYKALPSELAPLPCLEVRPGDVLLTRANTPELVGDVCVVRRTRQRLMLCDLVYRVNLRDSIIDRRFFVLWLLSQIGHSQIRADARGSSLSMVKISQAHIKSWIAVVPPIREQRAIVRFLDSEVEKIDALMESVGEANKRLKELRTTLISAAVTGKIDIRGEVA